MTAMASPPLVWYNYPSNYPSSVTLGCTRTSHLVGNNEAVMLGMATPAMGWLAGLPASVLDLRGGTRQPKSCLA